MVKVSMVQFSSVTQSCPVLCNPMDCSTPDFPVYHQLRELAQTHVHWFGDDIQPSQPLWSPSPSVFNLSQPQCLFQSQFFASDSQSTGASASSSVFPMNIPDWFSLRLAGLISLLSKGLSRVFSNHSSKASILWCSPWPDGQMAWWTMDRGSWHCTGDRNQDHPQEKEMQKSKMAVWGGLTNTCEKKGSEKQRRKGKIYPFECWVPKNRKERKENLPQWSVQRKRGKQ